MVGRWKAKGQPGYILILVLVIMAFGSVAIGALLGFASTALQGQARFVDKMLERQAAEAGLKQVMADLIRGADAINTTYTMVQPHTGGEPYSTFYFSTSYTSPSLAVNYLTPSFAISEPASQVMPTATQQYIDPGLANPDLATLPTQTAYLLRLFNVKTGVIQVNWAYSPAGVSRVGVWEGVPVDRSTGQPYPPGRIAGWPQAIPILDIGQSPGNATYNRTAAINVTAGVYSIVFYNSSGVSTKTTAAFAPSGGTGDTWVYVKAYRDYLISATAGGATIDAYVRQIPGYSQPPNTNWSTSNSSWITNSVYLRSFNRP